MRIIENFDLTEFNAYRVTSRCKRAFFPDSVEDVVHVFSDVENPKIVLGNGNNHILSQGYYAQDFIIFNGNFNKIEVNETSIHCQAGATLAQLSEIALVNELTGAETFWDIPSSIGGAVVMNAGASGDEIKDILVSAKYIDRESLVLHEINKEAIGFDYRNSFFQKNPQHLVLEAVFSLREGERGEIFKKMNSTKKTRWSKQPRDFPNCGSVFKRPSGMYVGPMLDELQLKGFTVGGAQVSKKHSGFIINIGNATGKDILDLITIIQEKVQQKYGVLLEVEQRVI